MSVRGDQRYQEALERAESYFDHYKSKQCANCGLKSEQHPFEDCKTFVKRDRDEYLNKFRRSRDKVEVKKAKDSGKPHPVGKEDLVAG